LERYVCVHGHFYQPPRENPWLEAIEAQDSAYPYHDWNVRIDAECYAPNSASRILDGDGRIIRIVNNYARISFNFGPTLLAWMKDKSPETYQLVIAADHESRKLYSGHGSALAQAYNHLIMPLANRRDKHTQVVWGIRDFQHRFGRFPEGMWLPETAVDLETLDILAEQGIRFTILSPYQARRVRPTGSRTWRDVSGGRIDPKVAYELRLPSGRRINLFFYDGPISRAVAFEKLLDRGEHLAERIVGSLPETAGAQLGHIATDGETYGHHHRRGEMALSYALHHLEEKGLARLTNYGEFLSNSPPGNEVQIFENTSWSCSHGVERWRSNCGCNSGRGGWNQEWRLPLRQALDWLRDRLAVFYEEKGRELLKDPWGARDEYIDVILDRAPESRDGFLERHAARELSEEERIAALKLLELQRHAMLMYTSCGWFFDELSGIETVQVILYAARALQLAHRLGAGDDLEPCFLDMLERARSNVPEHRDGRKIYETFVRPAVIDLHKVGVHYAVSSIFEDEKREGRIYSYSVQTNDYRLYTAGKARLALGRARVTSEITQDSADLTFGVLHLGDQVSGGIRSFRGDEAYENTAREISEAFQRGEFPEVIRVVDREFGAGTYSLKLLFRDEQRRIVREILKSSLSEAESAYRQLYQNNVSLMRFVATIGMPLPKRLEMAAEFTLNNDLRRVFEDDALDFDRINALVEEARIAGVPFDAPTLDFALRKTLERLGERLSEEPGDLELLWKLERGVGLARSLPFEVVLWRVQNLYYNLALTVYPQYREKASLGDEEAQAWLGHFKNLGGNLMVATD
jgi:alpha-amylase/alpha-mannosidase (GH57 family)